MNKEEAMTYYAFWRQMVKHQNPRLLDGGNQRFHEVFIPVECWEHHRSVCGKDFTEGRWVPTNVGMLWLAHMEF